MKDENQATVALTVGNAVLDAARIALGELRETWDSKVVDDWVGMVMGRTGCVQITALVDRMESLRYGARAGIEMDPALIHLFDRQSGISLNCG